MNNTTYKKWDLEGDGYLECELCHAHGWTLGVNDQDVFRCPNCNRAACVACREEICRGLLCVDCAKE
jgi:hypothetical protein